MNDRYQQIIKTLQRCQRVLITTHVRPDGDAIGTSAALFLGLKTKGIHADVLLLSHLPRKYAFVFEENAIPFIDVENGWPEQGAHFTVQRAGAGEDRGSRIEDGAAHSRRRGAPSSIVHPPSSSATSNPLGAYDALLVADTGTWSQLPGLRERLANFPGPRIVLDHHLTQEDWATHKLVIPEAAAAGEIAAELLGQWDVAIDRAIASCLFVAIASDTGWFQFANTRPFTLRLAATLMEKGVDTDRLYQLLYQNERPERVALQARALQSLELLAGGKLAVMTITKQDFAETKAGVPDTENLINIPLQVRTVEVSVLLTEPLDNPNGAGPAGPVRVSFRSKGQVDVAKFAEQFQGGGHARASGAKLDGTLAAARERVTQALMRVM